MTIRSRSVLVVLAACLMLSFAGVAAAQYSVVAVMPDGTVILKGPSGTRSYEVPAGTTFNADGKPGTPVSGLKPGMNLTGQESGIANWKSSSVMVHQQLNAEVVTKSGNSMLIRGSNGLTEKYEWSNASDITLVKDGKVVDISSINVGDRITGMMVQKAVDTSAADAAAAKKAAEEAAARKAAADKAAADAAAKAAADKAAADAAAKAAADKAAADAAAKAAADKAAADAAAMAAAHKKLPKTASEVPFVGLVGLLSLAAGVGLTAIRKSRSAK